MQYFFFSFFFTTLVPFFLVVIIRLRFLVMGLEFGSSFTLIGFWEMNFTRKHQKHHNKATGSEFTTNRCENKFGRDNIM